MKTTWRGPFSLPFLLVFFAFALAGCGEGRLEPATDSGVTAPDGGTGGTTTNHAGRAPGSGGSTGVGIGGVPGSAGTGGRVSDAGTGGMPSSGTGGMTGAGGRVMSTGGTAGSNAGMGGVSGSGGGSGGSPVAPAVRVVGRTVLGPGAGSLQYSWPGVNVQAGFTGTQISMMVNSASGNNRVTIVVDGGTPRTLSLASGQSTVALASGLPNGNHEIIIWRNTEASPGGLLTFNGLTGFGGGALVAPPSAPARRMEMIGDSLSVGAGVEGNATCTGGIDAYTNNYLAYGSVAARAVSADVVTIAYSGIGVYRNFNDTIPTAASLTMPRRYLLSNPL